jgi:hypothetical protein
VRQGYAAGELQRLFAPMGEAPIELTKSPPVRMESFRLTDHETDVLRALARPVSLARLVAERCVRGDVEVEEVLRAVFLGLSCGLASCEGWPGSSVP